MFNQQHGGAPPHGFDQFGQADGLVGPHARHGLVQQQHAGPGGQRQGKLHLALLAVRQGAGGSPQQAGVDGAFPGQLARLLIQRGLGRPRLPEAEAAARVGLDGQHQVVQHAGLFEDIGDLVGPRQPGRHALVRIHAGNVAPSHGQRARIGGQRAGQQVNQRGLARAVRPDQGVDLARVQGQRHIVGGHQRAEPAHQPAGLQGGRPALRGGVHRSIHRDGHEPTLPDCGAARPPNNGPNSPTRPRGAPNTTHSSSTPSGKCQYSVHRRSTSSRVSITTAPATPP
ncbi:hypothetical protein D3C85_609840 [compost metagenome]